MSRYRIREVDGDDHATAIELRDLHDQAFGDTAPQIEPEIGFWWIARDVDKKEAVAFAGMKPSAYFTDVGYLCRSGVMPEHRGNNLQVRLLRAREARARRSGWSLVITDTTDNVPSANSLIRAGYKLYVPKDPWGPSTFTLYWRKELN